MGQFLWMANWRAAERDGSSTGRTQEVAARMSAGAAVSWGWRIHFQALSLWLSAGCPWPPWASFARAAQVSSWHGTWLPPERVMPERGQGGSCSAFNDITSKIIYCHFLLAFLRSRPLGPAYTQNQKPDPLPSILTHGNPIERVKLPHRVSREQLGDSNCCLFG